MKRDETPTTTRHGRATVGIVLEVDRREQEVGKAIANIRALRERNEKVTVQELLSAREERRA